MTHFHPLSCSGIIALGGTAQTLLNPNPARNGYWIENTSAGPLYIDDSGSGKAAVVPTSGTATDSITLIAGAIYQSPEGAPPTGVISILGATTGQTFSAREF